MYKESCRNDEQEDKVLLGSSAEHERLLVCDSWSKTFRHKSSLSRHKKKQNVEQPNCTNVLPALKSLIAKTPWNAMPVMAVKEVSQNKLHITDVVRNSRLTGIWRDIQRHTVKSVHVAKKKEKEIWLQPDSRQSSS